MSRSAGCWLTLVCVLIGGCDGDAGADGATDGVASGSGASGAAQGAGGAGTGGSDSSGSTSGSSGGSGATGGGGSGMGPDTSCGNGATLEVPSGHASVAEALAAANDGDTILVAPGTYQIDALTISKKNITLTSGFCKTQHPGDIENAVLNGSVVFEAGAADGGRLLGLTVLDPGGKDTIGPQAAGTQILFNRIFGSDDTVALDGQAGPVLIYGNYIKSDGGDDNIDIDGKFDVTIEKNTLDTAAQDGIEMRFHDGISQLQTIIIRDNIIKDSGQDAIQFMDGYGVDPKLRKIRIERNLLLRAGTAGVGMNHQSNSTQSYLGEPIEEEIVILNNSFVDCGAGISGGANTLAANNVFQGIETRALWKVVGNSRAVNNLFFMNAKDQEQSSVDLSDNLMRQDPLLGADFTLGDGSPAIDAGEGSFDWQGGTITVTPGFDKGAAPDLGAFEKK